MGSILEAEGPNMAGGLGSREREAIFKELGCKVISCPGLKLSPIIYGIILKKSFMYNSPVFLVN